MSIELNIETAYEGEGNKRISFSDLRQTYHEIVNKAKEEDVDSSFFTAIVRRMVGMSKASIERAQYFAHYFEAVDAAKSAQTLVVFMKEIASMDPALEIRIRRRLETKLNNFAGLMNISHVQTGKDKDGQWVVKLAHVTSHEPVSDVAAYNTYDNESQERVSWSDPFPTKGQALYHGMWLAGALNVRHVDEDDLPKL